MRHPIFCLLFFLYSIGLHAQVDPLIERALQQTGSCDLICILHTPYQQVHKFSNPLDTKEQKGAAVFKRLYQQAQQSQGPIIQYLQKQKITHRSYYIINAIHIPNASRSLVVYLTSLKQVDRLEFNSNFKVYRPASDKGFPAEEDYGSLESRSPTAVEWGISRIMADTLWSLGITGKGAVVGSEDTGVELHPAIKNNYRGLLVNGSMDHNFNWHDAIHALNPLNNDINANEYNNPCGLDTLAPCDDDNHGTHTVGTMVAHDLTTGVAPDSKWIGCRCMERGWGTLATYLECFQWFLAPTDTANKNPNTRKAPHVINNSWGCPVEEGCNPANFKTMEQVISTLKAAGIFIVASAGNSGSLGCSSIDDPAAIFEASFSVGAIARNDSIAGFSSRGPVTIDGSGRIKPNITAPGVAVRSTIKNGGFASFNGTSMSGPHVAGAVALLISAFPSIAGRIDLIENILEQSADRKFVTIPCGKDSVFSIPNNVYGYGRLNVFKAYELTKQLLTTGQADLPVIKLKVYPNPTRDMVWMELAPEHKPIEVQLYNMQGQLVVRHINLQESTFILDIKGLPSGIYYYLLSTSAGLKTGKVIKS